MLVTIVECGLTEQWRLAEALACGNRGAAEYHSLLRWWGFRGFTVGLRAFLQHLLVLEAAYQALAREFPELAVVWNRMLLARATLARLDSLGQESNVPTPVAILGRCGWPSFNVERPHLRAPDSVGKELSGGTTTRWADWRYPVPIEPPAAPASSPGALMYAASLAVLRTWDGYADRLDSTDFNGIAVAEDFGAQVHYPILWTGLDFEWAGAHQPLQECVSHLERLFLSPTQPTGLDTAELPRCTRASDYAHFLRLLRRTRVGIDGVPSLLEATLDLKNDSEDDEDSEGDEADEPEQRWGRRASSELTDRELLPEARYGLDLDPRRSIAALLNVQPLVTGGRCNSTEDVVNVAAGYYLLAAIACSKTFEQAGRIAVIRATGDGRQTDWPADSLIAIDRDEDARIGMYRVPGRYESDRLTLPLLTAASWPEHCVDFEIHELFALPQEKLAEFSRRFVSRKLRRTPKQSDLIVKHAMAREMFAFDANRATIEFVCGEPLQSQGPDSVEGPERSQSRETEVIHRSPLSHYVSPHSLCVRNAFRYGWMRLAQGSNEAPFAPESCTDEQACMLIPVNVMRSLVALLATQSDPLKCPDHRIRHGHLAVYTAAMYEACTGHRLASELLYFLFTLDEPELVAFLVDKLQMGSEARYVAVVQLLIDQVHEYRKSGLAMARIERGSRPEIADAIEVALGVRAAAPVPGAPTIGALFRFGPNGPETLGTADVDEALARAAAACSLVLSEDIETRLLRRNLITFMANVGAPGYLLEMQAGHNGDMHLFGLGSTWIPLDKLAETRPLIQRYLVVNGWQLVKAQVQTDWVLPSPIAPGFVRGEQSFERRDFDHGEARDRVRGVLQLAIDAEALEQAGVIELKASSLNRIDMALARSARGDEQLLTAMRAEMEALKEEWRRGEGFVVDARRVLETLRSRAPNPLPHSNSGDTGYANLLLCRAISDVATPERLAGEVRMVVTNESVTRIRDRVKQLLPGDPGAVAKVREQLAAMAEGWRRSGNFVVQASSVNLARFTPGPIHIEFGRHLAISRQLLSELPGVIDDYLTGRPVDSLHRLAMVAVLLVMTEGVLNEIELEPLIDEVQSGDPIAFEGQWQFRATISTDRVVYDRTVDLTDKCAAAVLGYLQCREDAEPIPWSTVLREADALVLRLAGRESGMNLERLQIIMRPFWFLRLPSALYAECAGDVDTMAPSESSALLLLGEAPPELAMNPPVIRTRETDTGFDVASGAKLCRSLIANAREIVEKRHANSRTQRKKLRQALASPASSGLLQLSTMVPIVAAWTSFVEYMVAVGGKRQRHLRFNSIGTYQSLILDSLLAGAWGIDPFLLDSRGLDALYDDVIQRVQPRLRSRAQIALRLFHRHLRSWFGAPACSRFPASEPTARVARSVLLPWSVVSRAITQCLSLTGKTGRLGPAAAARLAMDSSFGLRSQESYGARRRDFPRNSLDQMRVAANSARSIKTFGRTVPVNAGSANLRELVDTQIRQSKVPGAGTEHDWLFGDPMDHLANLPDRDLSQIQSWAVKSASGDPLAVSYNLRHLYAGSAALRILAPERCVSPIASRFARSLAMPSASFAKLKPTLAHYPFHVDRLAYWLGHVDAHMVHQTYSHVGWTLASEYCARAANRKTWTDGVYGALLGIDRSSFARRRKKVDAADGELVPPSHLAVRKAVESYKYQDSAPPRSVRAIAEVAPAEPRIPRVRLWLADSLLLLRAGGHSDLSLAVADAVEQLAITPQDARQFFEGYRVVAEDLQFFDYEPSGYSEGRLARLGVWGSQLRRRELLARVEQHCLESANALAASNAIVSQWLTTACLPDQQPIVPSPGALDAWIAWFMAIGYRAENLEVLAFGWDHQHLSRLKAAGHSVVLREKSISGTRRIAGVGESTVVVIGPTSLAVGRDVWRVLLSMAAMLPMGLVASNK